MNRDTNLKYVLCNICGEDNHERFIKKDDFQIVKCRNCGLTYVNPRLPDEEIYKIYDELYFTGGRRFGMEDYFGREMKMSEKRAKETIKMVKKIKLTGNLLDVGCAGGIFLKVVKDNGYNPFGIEISKYACEMAEKNFDLRTYNVSLESFNFDEKFFDVITLLDVIEHFPDPYTSLLKIKTLLKDDGIIIIYTPNINSLPFYLIKEGWGIIAPEHHIYYFAPETIKKLLHKSGFTIKKLWFDEIGLAEAFLSHGSFTKIGININEEKRQKIAKNHYLFRDFIRNIFRYFDKRYLSYILGQRFGSAMKIIAVKSS